MISIPSPQDLNQAQEAHLKPLVEAAVTEIVVAMKNAEPGRITARVSMSSSVRHIVRKKFDEAGWIIKFHDDQRDGSFVEVSPK